MRALVTGATGFIGWHLVRALLVRGETVTCLHRVGSDVSKLQPLGVRLVSGDVMQPDSLAAGVRGTDVVYHLAGLTRAFSRRDFQQVNAGGTRNVLAACAAMACPPVVVLVSSLAATGPARGGRLREETEPAAPVCQYGRSKRAAELAAETYAAKVPITVVRPPLVFGEGDDCVLRIFRPVQRFGVHLVPTWRDHRFSLLHAADLADALVAAAKRGRRIAAVDAQGYYHVAGDEHPTYAELGRRIAAALGRRARVVHAPMLLTFAAAAATELAARLLRRPNIFNWDKAREAAAGSWTCSSARARQELGWSPAAALDERLRQTVAWYRRYGWL